MRSPFKQFPVKQFLSILSSDPVIESKAGKGTEQFDLTHFVPFQWLDSLISIATPSTVNLAMFPVPQKMI